MFITANKAWILKKIIFYENFHKKVDFFDNIGYNNNIVSDIALYCAEAINQGVELNVK